MCKKVNKGINTSMESSYGYVYIWYDTKYKKYIIGSHHGDVNDCYTTSTGGIHVRNIFKYRPETMRFRVLQYNTKMNDYKYTQELEQRWLDMRSDISNNPRYYNKTNQAGGGFDRDIQLKRVKNGTHHFLGGNIQLQSNLKRVAEGTHNFQSQDHRDKVSEIAKKRCKDGTHHFAKSEFNKIPIHLKCSDGREWEYTSKADAVRDGFKPGAIDKVKKYKEYKFVRGSYSGKIPFKKGDILYLC
jgi:hypothetical protein